MCSSYSFSISGLDGGELSASRPGRALTPRKGPPVPIVQEAGWAPRPIWTQRLAEKSFILCRGSNLDRPVYRVLVGKPEEKRPLGRPRRRWEDGIRMYLRDLVWGSVEWIQLAQDRGRWRAIVNTVTNVLVLSPRSAMPHVVLGLRFVSW
jgi:hypothetical protein